MTPDEIKGACHKVQITPGGKIQRDTGKIKRGAVPQQYRATVSISFEGVKVFCHPSAGEGYALEFSWGDTQTLEFQANTSCAVQSFLWCCGDPSGTNQNCIEGECGFPDAPFISDVTIVPPLDPPNALYPPPCVPVFRGFYSPSATYFVNEYVNSGGDFYMAVTETQGNDPPGPAWRGPLDEVIPNFGVGCTGRISYQAGASVTLSLFDGEWYLTTTFSLGGSVCGASVNAVYGLTFPINDNLGEDPTGPHHYDSLLGGTPQPPGTLHLDVEIDAI